MTRHTAGSAQFLQRHLRGACGACLFRRRCTVTAASPRRVRAAPASFRRAAHGFGSGPSAGRAAPASFRRAAPGFGSVTPPGAAAPAPFGGQRTVLAAAPPQGGRHLTRTLSPSQATAQLYSDKAKNCSKKGGSLRLFFALFAAFQYLPGR